MRVRPAGTYLSTCGPINEIPIMDLFELLRRSLYR